MILISKQPRLIDRHNGGNARPICCFAGQSNVDGVVPIANLEAEYQNIYREVKFYNQSTDMRMKLTPMDYSNEFTYKAGNPNAGGFFTFQFYLYPELAELLGQDVTILHHAFGGTSLATNWKSTATLGSLWTELVFKTRALKNATTDADGVAPDFKFFYWGQGENDARTLGDANAYQTNLTNFINNYRTVVGDSSLPFLIGALNPDIANATTILYPYWETVRDAQEAVVAAMSNVYLVNNDAAEMAADWIHYTADGYKTIKDNILSVITANNLLS